MNKKVFILERECVHYEKGAEAEPFNGAFYIQALQRLRGDEAVRVSRNVAPFFWADAQKTRVWLCHDCAAELNLAEGPRAVLQAGARR
ncbi:MAG: hypothetical protein ABIP75_08075 [Pyrinomonadaceae bacterium]